MFYSYEHSLLAVFHLLLPFRYIPLAEEEVVPPLNTTAHLSNVPPTLSQPTGTSTLESISSVTSRTRRTSTVEIPHSRASVVPQVLGTSTAELVPSTSSVLSDSTGASSVVAATPCRPVGRISRKRPLQDLDDDTIVLEPSPETVDLTQT